MFLICFLYVLKTPKISSFSSALETVEKCASSMSIYGSLSPWLRREILPLGSGKTRKSGSPFSTCPASVYACKCAPAAQQKPSRSAAKSVHFPPMEASFIRAPQGPYPPRKVLFPAVKKALSQSDNIVLSMISRFIKLRKLLLES